MSGTRRLARTAHNSDSGKRSGGACHPDPLPAIRPRLFSWRLRVGYDELRLRLAHPNVSQLKDRNIATARNFDRHRLVRAFASEVTLQAIPQRAGLRADNAVIPGVVVDRKTKNAMAYQDFRDLFRATRQLPVHNIIKEGAQATGPLEFRTRRDSFHQRTAFFAGRAEIGF